MQLLKRCLLGHQEAALDYANSPYFQTFLDVLRVDVDVLIEMMERYGEFVGDQDGQRSLVRAD
jgi:hypothetical protein